VATAVVALAVVLALAWAVRSVFGRIGKEPAPATLDATGESSIPAAGPVSTEMGESAPDDPTALREETPPGRSELLAPPPEPAAEPVPSEGGRLSVSEFGVGSRVVNRRLEGESDRFAEGTVAYFLTRVLGGETGESIRHVWLREGGVVQKVDLPLGGPHWRTHSRKTLHGLGLWTVEARDEDDRVLARASFTCVPAGD
jgi:hypothetical protein